ncbi:hypothetical protein JWG40_18095 [Leptospira sp. 201903074]|uniref:hypothetical protein n=1 Tax=Leptospira abararensis TaxID=2810036 RepID=UPI001965410A|nr:hypothetical protein [Leptospira abararensis]MBM9548944.1 hypothetical protein [Leptospira abararensis]
MNFVDLNSLNISTELDILKRDTQPNSILLYQHKGIFFANNNRIGNVDQDIAQTKFLKLLEKAKEDNIALVLSPEYSCPKSVINYIINNENMKPTPNKIWVLAGESINKEEVRLLVAINQTNIFIHCEDVYTQSDKCFLNPLYYIFFGQHEGLTKLIILIQFKTRHMGGLWSGGQIEANNLIEGNDIYIIKNSNDSTRLVTFICSEAMNVKDELTVKVKEDIDWNDKPFLILNPQINPNPSHPEFIKFRNFIFESEKKEVVSLNWGKETYANNNPWYSEDVNSPRSGIFFKTLVTELDHSTSKIIKNHNKGFYFLYQNRNKFVYFLNGNLELIQIQNKSVDINQGVPQQRRRSGPEAIRIYNLNNEMSGFIEQETIHDKHIEFFQERGIENHFLLDPINSIVDKERLINISTGLVNGKSDNEWHEVIYLNSFNLKEADECNCRMTYVEDTYPASESNRELICTNLSELDQQILPNKSNYPDSIKDLIHQNILLSYSQDAHIYKYKYNITNDNGEIRKATICYLGNASISKVRRIYDELQKLFEYGTEGKRRIVVFYKIGINLNAEYDKSEGSITNPPKDNTSFL